MLNLRLSMPPCFGKDLLRLRIAFGLIAIALFGFVTWQAEPARSEPLASRWCDTPVYRYAMYRWQPAEYELYCITTEATRGSFQELREYLNSVGEEDDAPNLFVMDIDATSDPDLLSVPPPVREAWQARSDETIAGIVLASPLSVPLYAGKVDSTSLASLIDGPIRQQIATRLAESDPCCLVMLPGNDQSANEAAENELARFVKNLPPPPTAEFEMPPSSAANDKVSYFVLSGSTLSPAEQVDARHLRSMLVKPSDDSYEDAEPRVFAVYGRGRVAGPIVGPEIDRPRLHGLLDFVRGPCACVIKDQNPGFDLMLRSDWEAAANRMVERFGSEEGNEGRSAEVDFFPQLLVGSDPPSQNDRSDPEILEWAQQAEVSGALANSPTSGDAANENAKAQSPSEAIDAPQGDSEFAPASGGFSWSLTTIVGVLIIATVVLVILTTVVARLM